MLLVYYRRSPQPLSSQDRCNGQYNNNKNQPIIIMYIWLFLIQIISFLFKKDKSTKSYNDVHVHVLKGISKRIHFLTNQLCIQFLHLNNWCLYTRSVLNPVMLIHLIKIARWLPIYQSSLFERSRDCCLDFYVRIQKVYFMAKYCTV